MQFYDCFNVYNILMDDEIWQNFKQVKICGMYKWILWIFSLSTFKTSSLRDIVLYMWKL